MSRPRPVALLLIGVDESSLIGVSTFRLLRGPFLRLRKKKERLGFSEDVGQHFLPVKRVVLSLEQLVLSWQLFRRIGLL